MAERPVFTTSNGRARRSPRVAGCWLAVIAFCWPAAILGGGLGFVRLPAVAPNRAASKTVALPRAGPPWRRKRRTEHPYMSVRVYRVPHARYEQPD